MNIAVFTPVAIFVAVHGGLVSAATMQTRDLYDIILPTSPPATSSIEYWECTTWDLESYFRPPQPTGNLFHAMMDYGVELRNQCETKTVTIDFGNLACDFPYYDKWCDFTSVAAATLLPEYASYGSVASSWWAARSKDAVMTADLCRHEWFKAKISVPYGGEHLNRTLAYGHCYAERNSARVTGDGAKAAAPTASPTAMTGQTRTTAPGQPVETNAGGNMEARGKFMLPLVLFVCFFFNF